MIQKFKLKILMLVLLTSCFFSFSQDNKNQKSNSNANLFVLGIIKINDPIKVTYIQKHTKSKLPNWFITTKNNIPFILENERNISYLVYDTDYYELNLHPNSFIYQYVFPLCDDKEKNLIKYMYHGFHSKHYSLLGTYKRRVSNDSYSKEKIYLTKNIYYEELTINSFILILVNYSWYVSQRPLGIGPMDLLFGEHKDKKGIYRKVLIPVVEIEIEDEEKWWSNE